MTSTRSAKRAIRAGVAVTVAGVTATAMLAGSASAATGGSQASAFALSAEGPVPIDPVSAVSSTGSPESTSAAELPENPLLSASALSTQASPGRARASVADLNLGDGAIAASLITATCTNGAGSAKLADLVIGGQHMPASPAPNTTISVPPEGGQVPTDKAKALTDKVKSMVGDNEALSDLQDRAKTLADSGLKVTLTLNKQVPGDDGSLTVTALELKVSVGGKSETISVASATCNAVSNATPTIAPTQPAGNEAPAPEPVTGDFTVTG